MAAAGGCRPGVQLSLSPSFRASGHPAPVLMCLCWLGRWWGNGQGVRASPPNYHWWQLSKICMGLSPMALTHLCVCMLSTALSHTEPTLLPTKAAGLGQVVGL